MIKSNEYHKNLSTINWGKLKEKEFKLLCIDLDNTLDFPDRETKYISPDLRLLLKEIDLLGFELIIFSNNYEERVKSFADLTGYKYISYARKPFPKNYKHKYLNKYNKKEIVFIGDKIITDVIGGNLFGGYTILVDPLTKDKKHWYTKIMSLIENTFRGITRFKKGCYFD